MDSTDTGNTQATAKDLGDKTYNVSTLGVLKQEEISETVGADDTADFFKFSVTQANALYLDLSATASTKFQILNSAAVALGTLSAGASSGSYRYMLNLDTGTYYLKASTADSTERASYIIKTLFAPTDTQTDTLVMNSFGAAIIAKLGNLAANGTITKTATVFNAFGFNGNNQGDSYTFTLTEDAKVKFDLTALKNLGSIYLNISSQNGSSVGNLSLSQYGSDTSSVEKQLLAGTYSIGLNGYGGSKYDSASGTSGTAPTQYQIQLTTGTGVASDTTPPIALTFNPVDEAGNVAIASNILVTFNESIAKGIGTIVLKTAAGVTVATFDTATSTNLSIADNTLTINPTADLAYSTGYKVEFAAGSIKDLAGNAYAGTTSYNFTTVAGTGNQTLTGTSGADTFTSRPGNDTIDGGAGTDTAIFNGNLANYTLTKSGSTYTVRAKSGTDGTDTLSNVESLKFIDVTVNLQVKSIASSAPLADVQRISELYVAFFNRTPDADGLAYWIGQKVAGQSINQISESFYNVGASSTFSALTGFSTSMTNADFLNVFYKNVLGRPEGADAGGLTYWNAKLADGSSTRSSLANDILDSAHTFKGNATWGWVADLLDNKIAVANTIAVDWGLTYNTDAYARSVAIAAAITPTNTAVALALVGVSAADLSIA